MAELTGPGMSLLPASTNDAYGGMKAAAWGLTVIAAATIIPALLHIGLPDGGAGVIAGLDLTGAERTIISLFAWAGTTQLVWGLMLLAVSLRYRSLVPLALGLLTLERALHTWNMWGPKGSHLAGGHHPPEVWATVGSVPVLLILLAMSLRRA
ncbi:hypothetical protein [Hyphomonas sp.]|uniref:hypothetical protein n=1 Tax=Hyphomonas sp. TaxID=87 RepID=UPI0037C189E9